MLCMFPRIPRAHALHGYSMTTLHLRIQHNNLGQSQRQWPGIWRQHVLRIQVWWSSEWLISVNSNMLYLFKLTSDSFKFVQVEVTAINIPCSSNVLGPRSSAFQPHRHLRCNCSSSLRSIPLGWDGSLLMPLANSQPLVREFGQRMYVNVHQMCKYHQFVWKFRSQIERIWKEIRWSLRLRSARRRR